MRPALLILLLILTAHQSLLAQTVPNSRSEQARCGVSEITAALQAAAYSAERINPQLDQWALERAQFNRIHSTQQVFWAYDVAQEEFYTTLATLRFSDRGLQIWVEDDSWQAGYLTENEVDELAAGLLDYTPEESVMRDRGILAIDTLAFGKPPDAAGDGILRLLVLDIRDGYEDSGGFIAGYFFPVDQDPAHPQSNEMDLLYLDAFPGIYNAGMRSTITALSTSAHELQHLIHYRYDPEEDIWLDEGLSELGSWLCGYGLSNPFLFFQNPNRGLTVWENQLRDYARVGLWSLYLAEQFASDSMGQVLNFGFLRALVADKETGAAGIDNALLSAGYAEANFLDVFNNWTIANGVNEIELDARYGYRYPVARIFSANTSAIIEQYPASAGYNLGALGAGYFRLSGEGLLTLSLSRAVSQATLVHVAGQQLIADPIFANPHTYGSLNPDDEFLLILNSTHSLNGTLCAHAPFSLNGGALVSSGENECLPLNAQPFDAATVYPNPSTGSLFIRLNLVADAELSLSIYNIRGQRVAHLKRTVIGSARETLLTWEDLTAPGIPPPAVGIYIIRSELRGPSVPGGRQTFDQKFVVVR